MQRVCALHTQESKDSKDTGRYAGPYPLLLLLAVSALPRLLRDKDRVRLLHATGNYAKELGMFKC